MREVQCIICDTKALIDERTAETKRLRNDPIKTFMRSDCRSRLDTPRQRPNENRKFSPHFPNENL